MSYKQPQVGHSCFTNSHKFATDVLQIATSWPHMFYKQPQVDRSWLAAHVLYKSTSLPFIFDKQPQFGRSCFTNSHNLDTELLQKATSWPFIFNKQPQVGRACRKSGPLMFENSHQLAAHFYKWSQVYCSCFRNSHNLAVLALQIDSSWPLMFYKKPQVGHSYFKQLQVGRKFCRNSKCFRNRNKRASHVIQKATSWPFLFFKQAQVGRSYFKNSHKLAVHIFKQLQVCRSYSTNSQKLAAHVL